MEGGNSKKEMTFRNVDIGCLRSSSEGRIRNCFESIDFNQNNKSNKTPISSAIAAQLNLKVTDHTFMQ